MQTNTALLFFTRTAAAEATEKKLFSTHSTRVGRKLFQLFIDESRKKARASGLPLFEVNEHAQQGHGFGEKLSNAIESVFARGFNNVIVFGNDCQHLTTRTIQQAFIQLQSAPLVIGPDQQGGVYLLGISKAAFNRDVFNSLRWQTSNLLADMEQCFSYLPVYTLPVLSDVNHPCNLAELKNSLATYSRVRVFLKSIFAFLYSVFSTYNQPCYKHYRSSIELRGPPSLSLSI